MGNLARAHTGVDLKDAVLTCVDSLICPVMSSDVDVLYSDCRFF